MKCCVPFCNSSNNTLISQKVTYHKFPVDKYLRAAWLEALGIDESQVSDAAMVCSLHFNDSHFYDGKNGVKMVQRGAVPFVQVCMICLDTNCKLYPLGKYNLEQSYETITGLSLQQVQSHLTPTVCSECAQRLTNCNKFRGKSLRAHAVLLELFRKHSLLTVTNVKTINRSIFGLKSSITPKTFKPNHCDLNVIDDSYVEIELEGVEEKSIIKVEKQDEIVVAFDCKGKDQNESHENNSFTELAKKNNIIKNDLNEDVDIDIDIDFLNDDNDDDFLDDDDRLLDDTLKVVTDNKVNVTDHNLPERNTEVRLVDKINSDDTELVCNDNDKESPKNDVKNVKRTRKVTSANIKNSRNKVQTANKKAVTKKAVGPKTKRAPNSKVKSETTKSTRTPKNQVLTTFEITKLSHEEQLEEINKRKESSNYLNSSFQCNVCYRGFVSETTYTRHMEKHSKSFGELQCPVCKQYLKAQYALQKHVNSSHATRYSCTLCEFTTMACESARMHEFWHKGTKYKCTHCDAEFLKYTSYITHVRVKHPSDYICSQCGYSYLSEKGLLCHIARIHRLDKVEKPEGPECEECKVRFASETAYAQHLKVSPKHHTPETRAVNQAVPPRSYKKGAGYRKQDEDGDFVTCEQCGIRLKDYSMYMFHFKREHPDKNRTQYAPRPRAGLCELCGKSFQTPYHLKYHMSKHTGQKDFQCDVCEKRFRIKRFLDMHKATHAPREARRQYECPVCGKTFTSPSSLNRHVWIHKGKSFKCEICDKGFSNASERNCHVSHVHMKVPWPKRHRGPNRAGRPSLITDDNYDE